MYIEDKSKRALTHKSRGLSGLEFLIVLAAIAVIVLVSVPGSTFLLEDYRLKYTYVGLSNGLELARSEAQLRGSTVIMCPSSNGKSCRIDGNWDHGWLVFSDGNGDGAVQEVELIQAFEAPNPRIRIAAEGAVKRKASLTVIGLIEENGAQSGLFRICYRGSDSPPRIVNVNPEGWAEVVPPGDGICERA